TWKRRCFRYCDILELNVREILRQRVLSPLARPERRDGLDDFLIQLRRMQGELERVKVLGSVLPGNLAVIASKQSLEEAHSVARLTVMALTFVPLSFVASLFSMQGDVAPGGRKFWIFFAVALPLLALVFLSAFAGVLLRWKRWTHNTGTTVYPKGTASSL